MIFFSLPRQMYSWDETRLPFANYLWSTLLNECCMSYLSQTKINLEKLIVSHLVQKFPCVHGIVWFMTMFVTTWIWYKKSKIDLYHPSFLRLIWHEMTTHKGERKHYIYNNITLQNTVITYIYSAFCPYSVFICFRRFSQETTLISTNSNSCLVFFIEMHRVVWRRNWIFKYSLDEFRASRGEWIIIIKIGHDKLHYWSLISI